MFAIKQKSSIPIILRDMAPPEGSIFDPAIKWKEEKERREKAGKTLAETEAKEMKKNSSKKTKEKKQSTADAIRESNAEEKVKKDLERDLMKLSNLKTLKTLQD